MKRVLVIAICMAGAGLSSAQDTATGHPPHGVIVLKLSWSRKISQPRNDGLLRDEAPGGQRANPERKLREPSPIPNSPFPYLRKLPYFYVYSLKVRNAGPKKIRGVDWEYVTTDPVSGEELGRRRVIQYQEVKPGKVATLNVDYPSPPTNVVTPEGLGKDQRSPFKSSAEIKCVLYDDATVWEEAGGEGSACAELRRVDVEVRERKVKRL